MKRKPVDFEARAVLIGFPPVTDPRAFMRGGPVPGVYTVGDAIELFRKLSPQQQAMASIGTDDDLLEPEEIRDLAKRLEWSEERCVVRHKATGFTMTRHPGQPDPVFKSNLQDYKGYEEGDLIKVGTLLLQEQFEREGE